jgi:hypothetical protein
MTHRLLFNPLRMPTVVLAYALLCVARPAAAQTNELLTPLLTASVNGKGEPTAYQGWPLLLSIGCAHPEAFQPSTNVFTIGSTNLPWTNYLQITVTDPTGSPLSWPFQFIRPPANTLVLSSDDFIEVGLHLTPEQTALLPTNHYTVTVVLDSRATTDPTTWQGFADSVPVEITVLPEPATLPPDLAAEKAFVQAGYAVALGRSDQAGPVLDQLLVGQPTNIVALTFKSTLQEAQGNVPAALALTGVALENAFIQEVDSAEAPVALLRQQRRLLQKMNAPQLTAIQDFDGLLTLEWIGWPGERYVVEASYDLRTWITLATNLVSTTTNQVWSTNVSSSSTFYRLRW